MWTASSVEFFAEYRRLEIFYLVFLGVEGPILNFAMVAPPGGEIWWPNLELGNSAQKGTLCCIRELQKYLEVESSHLVTDYKHNLSLLN